jgi:hypothetical protein
MWPFKPVLKSDCCSGVITCDGKHHPFTTWKDIVVDGVIWKPGMSSPIEYRQNAQERTCVICNYRERRAIREDS